MSKIGDLIIQAEECQNNDERLMAYKKKFIDYQKSVEWFNEWWQELDQDQEYIKKHGE